MCLGYDGEHELPANLHVPIRAVPVMAPNFRPVHAASEHGSALDAELGRTMDTTDNGRRMRGGGVRVHSFDLVAANESVTKVRVRAPSSAEPAVLVASAVLAGLLGGFSTS